MNVYLMGRTMLKIEQLSLLATVVIAFSALAALVLTGQAGIRQDLRAVQTDLLAGQAELRREIRTVETKLREEIRAVETTLREEIRAVEATLREEIRAVDAELRTGQAELREDLGAVGVRLTVVEHRTEALDPRFALVEPPAHEWPGTADTPPAGSGPTAPPTEPFRPSQSTPSP